jgi:ornithine carbamoyltransferase
MAVAARVRHFLSIGDLERNELALLLEQSASLKARPSTGGLAGRTVALIFEKPSLRTRLSFDVGIAQLGGHCVYLSPAEVGLGRRESVSDVARVTSRMADAVVLRVNAHETIEEFARYSEVPVINGLSDLSHPCQGLADIFTIRERKGPDLRGVAIAYIGDGNNVAHSLMLCVAKTGSSLRIATPAGYEPLARYRELAGADARSTGAQITIGNDPVAAVTGADVVYTDVWTSMGQEQEYERRRRAFQGFQLNATLLARAKRDAIVLHDLPAHRGEEITDEVIDGPQSAVFDQAENRLHTEKALLCWLLGPLPLGGERGTQAMSARSWPIAARTGSSSGAVSIAWNASSAVPSARPSGRRPRAMPIVAVTDGHSSAARGPDRMLNSRTLRPPTDTSRTSSAAARRSFLRMAREWPRARSSVRSAVRSGRAQHSDSTVFVFRCSRRPVFASR